MRRPIPTGLSLLAALGGVVAFSASAAMAQDLPRVGRDGYRQDVPAVLSPPRPPPRPPESPFGEAYRRAGYPRMVLFFNRDIADQTAGQLVQRRQEVASTEREGRLAVREQSGAPSQAGTGGLMAPRMAALPDLGAPKDGDPGLGAPVPGAAVLPAQQAPVEPDAPAARRGEVEERSRTQTERNVEISVQRRGAGARAAPLDEASQWLFETGFTSRLATERVRMVDRAAAVRLAATARSTGDPQALEMAALRDHADLALLVRAAPMPGVAGGNLFRVTAVDTRRGTILADEVIRPPAGTPGSEVPSIAGDMAASTLMARLAALWLPAR